MYDRILVPVDGSAASNRGLSEALALAGNQRATLRLVHVVDESFLLLDVYGTGDWGSAMNAVREGGAKLLEEAKGRAASAGVPAEAVVLETLGRRVADIILSEASAWKADLIVMGTHGRRGFSHLVLGSDAEAVVHGAKVPILLVNAGQRGDGGP